MKIKQIEMCHKCLKSFPPGGKMAKRIYAHFIWLGSSRGNINKEESTLIIIEELSNAHKI